MDFPNNRPDLVTKLAYLELCLMSSVTASLGPYTLCDRMRSSHNTFFCSLFCCINRKSLRFLAIALMKLNMHLLYLQMELLSDYNKTISALFPLSLSFGISRNMRVLLWNENSLCPKLPDIENKQNPHLWNIVIFLLLPLPPLLPSPLFCVKDLYWLCRFGTWG